MPEYIVDLGSIIVEAKDGAKSKEKVRRLIEESNGADVVIDQAVRLDEEEEEQNGSSA